MLTLKELALVVVPYYLLCKLTLLTVLPFPLVLEAAFNGWSGCLSEKDMLLLSMLLAAGTAME